MLALSEGECNRAGTRSGTVRAGRESTPPRKGAMGAIPAPPPDSHPVDEAADQFPMTTAMSVPMLLV